MSATWGDPAVAWSSTDSTWLGVTTVREGFTTATVSAPATTATATQPASVAAVTAPGTTATVE